MQFPYKLFIWKEFAFVESLACDSEGEEEKVKYWAKNKVKAESFSCGLTGGERKFLDFLFPSRHVKYVKSFFFPTPP